MRMPKRDYWLERGFKSREEWLKSRMQQYRIKTSKPCLNCSESCWGNRMFCSNKCNILGNIKINKDGCWEWQKGKNQNGYGLAKDLDDRTQKKGNKQKTIATHRLSFIIFKGEIPEGLLVCHTCDNRSCCNPDHLWLGNHKSNARDALKKGRLAVENLNYRAKKGSPSNNAKLKDHEIIEIRKRIEKGDRIIEIAESYNVGYACIYNIKNGRTWTGI